jgi:two-component system, OmpR family, phosphate regulon response regulator PhoB
MSTKILVVDDEADLVELLAFNLEQEGYRVETAMTGAEAIRKAKRLAPDLVVLDLMLPDISGTDVCRFIKQSPETKNAAVLMLTARGEELDRVAGFQVGADDYVTKPFSVRELALRVKAILRRTSGADNGDEIVVGVLKINRPAHRVLVMAPTGVEEEIPLTALEFRLLLDLYERRGKVQSRDALLDRVWGISADVTTRTVDTHIKRLREKLGQTAGDYIETVRGVGYRFSNEIGG